MTLKAGIAKIFSGESSWVRVLLALGVAVATVLLYRGGLSGAFVLDDTPNLNVITQLPAAPHWRDFWYLTNTGFAGVLGRPLAVLSFLLQYQAWPDPFQFKLFNVLLHILNGVLLAGVCLLLRAQSRWQLTTPAIALVIFVWLVHPLQVSTVLYVVQRMTELATFFTLLGINLYLMGRFYLLRHQHRRGVALLLTGVFLCGALAVLCKESGALLLPLIAVLEFTLLKQTEETRLLILSRRVIVYLPTVLGVLAFIAYLPIALQGYDLKPFSFAERVLSQFPALLMYLANIALITPNYLGLFHDDFPLVTALLQPWYAVPAILCVLTMIVLAVKKHREWPLFAFAVLWFLIGHSLESSVLPLEVYFEHRNYLPLFGLVLAAVLKLQPMLQALNARHRALARAVLALGLLSMSLLNWQQSQLWGDPLAFAQASVAAHPQSIRAQSNLVETLSSDGQVQAAFDYHLSTVDPARPRIAQYIRWLEFRCLIQDSILPDAEILAQQALTSGHDYGAIFLLNNLTFGIIQNRCRQGPEAEIDIVLANLLQNPAFAVSAADLLQMQGFLAASRGNFTEAAELAAASFNARHDIRVALYRITWLLRAGLREQAVNEFQSLESTNGSDIRASSDLTARFNFLQQELR